MLIFISGLYNNVIMVWVFKDSGSSSNKFDLIVVLIQFSEYVWCSVVVIVVVLVSVSIVIVIVVVVNQVSNVLLDWYFDLNVMCIIYGFMMLVVSILIVLMLLMSVVGVISV